MCAKLIDLTGKRFGRLIVIERAIDKHYKKPMWKCQCDCGKIIITRGSVLTSGQSQSCGCLAAELKLHDLTGKKFGKLTVLKRDEDHITQKGYKVLYWICQCECGTIKSIRGSELVKGGVRSCGCSKGQWIKEAQKQMHKDKNRYDLSGDFGICYLANEQFFWFDLEDYDKIKNYTWRYDKQGYVVTTIKKRPVALHRYIMGVTDRYLYVDHIVHLPRAEPKYDNRKSNLRIVTPAQNSMNTHVNKNSKSGYKGVYFYQKTNSWTASITVAGVVHSLGYFKTKEEAIKARQNAEKEYFKEYALKQMEVNNE